MPHIAPRKNEQGQATAELAIVLPVLAVLLFGILQFGVTFNHYLALTDAVRAGARVAAVSRHESNPVGITETRLREAAPDLRQTDLKVNVASSWSPGSTVTVTATYPYSINVLGMVVASGNLTSSTQERVE